METPISHNPNPARVPQANHEKMDGQQTGAGLGSRVYDSLPIEEIEEFARLHAGQAPNIDNELSPKEIALSKTCSLRVAQVLNPKEKLGIERDKTRIYGLINNQEVSLRVDANLIDVYEGAGNTVFHVTGSRDGVELSSKEASDIFQTYRNIACKQTTDSHTPEHQQ
jgi:hypothetical protein